MASRQNSSVVERKKRLKCLLEQGEEIKSSAISYSDKIAQISSIVAEANKLSREGAVEQRAQNTSEVVMDAQVLKMSHELMGEVMKEVSTSEFSDDDFQNALARIIYKDDVENWDALANIATGIAHTTKFSNCLLGTIDGEVSIAEKQVKERQKRQKGKLAKESQPENVEKFDKQDEATIRVNYVYKQIRRLYAENNNEPIPFYKLVIDPNDFMRSIDNIFQVSFLMKDDKVATELGDDGYPTIRPAFGNENLSRSNENSVQAVCSINLMFMKEMIEKYNITRPLLDGTNQQNLPRSQGTSKSRRSSQIPSTSRSGK